MNVFNIESILFFYKFIGLKYMWEIRMKYVDWEGRS